MKIRPGNFGMLGTDVHADKITFTFTFEDASSDGLALYDASTFEPVAQFGVSEGRCIGHVCSITLKEVNPEKLCYLLRVDGTLRMDPYARRVVGRDRWDDRTREGHAYQVFGGFALDREYEWHDDAFCPLEDKDLLIYKLHMRGFTMQHRLPARDKGNVRGFLKRLKEIADLGFTAVEFMPIYDFEEIRLNRTLKVAADGSSYAAVQPEERVNYWGYGGGAYFAPKASYFMGDSCTYEMKHMVDVIHSRGMEIYMEVSYAPDTPDDVICDSLVWWVREYHIDGFHFLGMGLPIERIINCPYLADTRLFYDLFPQRILDEQRGRKHLYVCNNDFMYALRRLQNHQDGSMQEMAGQLKRQADHYGFVNYAANNNGFTLYDAYSYGEKHNEDNGEDNRDGSNYNCSDNYGVEGRTSSTAVTATRLKHVRTALAAVLLGQGIPMVLSGDEVLNSQEGNNNAYCQDNPVGWVQYFNGRHQRELKEFVRRLIALRRAHPVLSETHPYQMSDYRHLGMPDLSYHGREPWMVNVGQEKKALGILYNGQYADDCDVFICFNFHYEWENFALPSIAGKEWYAAGNTMNYDIYAYVDSPEAKASFLVPVRLEDQSEIIVEGGSVTVLVSRKCKDDTVTVQPEEGQSEAAQDAAQTETTQSETAKSETVTSEIAQSPKTQPIASCGGQDEPIAAAPDTTEAV